MGILQVDAPVKAGFRRENELVNVFSYTMVNEDFFVVTPAKAMLLGIAIVVALFVWEGHQGFNLWDEGYLWYGVQRVMSGEVPIRDFQAYDPGRYYWSATLMRLSDSHGIMALRETVVIIQAFALAAALGFLAAAARKRSDFLFLVLCALTLAVWMVPRHKLFDISLSIALVGVLAILIERPSYRRYFGAGVMVGAAACFGRNHGMYGMAASLGTLFFLSLRCKDWSAWRRGVGSFLAGLVAGYLPIILMILLVPEFASAFVESVKFLFEIKATNLPLPVPWPWKVHFSGITFSDSLRQLLIGCFFVATLVFGCLAPLYVIVSRIKGKPLQPLFVACAFSALPYAHYAFSRADTGHLAQGIFPLLIGVLTVASQNRRGYRWLAAGALCMASLFAMIVLHPGWQCMGADSCERVLVSGDRLVVDRGTARDVALLNSLYDRFGLQSRSFFAAPFWPGAYALFDIKAPNWEIYTAWPRSDAFQREEIARLNAAKPSFVVIFDYPLDGRDDLRYRNTHPLIERYVRDNFTPMSGITDYPDYQIYYNAHLNN